MEREALKLALEALEGFYDYGYSRRICFEHITTIKEALAQPPLPAQEIVAWHYLDDNEKNKIAFSKNDATNWGSNVRPLVFGDTPPLPVQRQPLPPASPCPMTEAEYKLFKLGWLECESAHNIGGVKP
jgi:hypothetical protein